MPPFTILVYSVGRTVWIMFQSNAQQKVMNPRQGMLISCSSNAFGSSGLSCIRRYAIYAGHPTLPMAMWRSVLGGEYCQQKRDGHHCKYIWIQCWGVGSQNVATVVKSDPYTTPETVIGHFTVLTEHHAWFVGMIAMSQRSAKFRKLQYSVVKPMPI